MRRLIRAMSVLLMMSVLPSARAAAQVTIGSAQETGGFTLEDNYSNPFDPETRIPFVLHEDLFDDGRAAVVTMRIYNLIRQPVAVPEVLIPPMGEARPLVQLRYRRPGRHEAYWDAHDFAGAKVASGVYWVQLTVNGVSKARKIIVTEQTLPETEPVLPETEPALPVTEPASPR
ncbi:MAG: hypothetical protein RQ745_11860 [Longimicrobiales bacterium]|nr:hypothetical protein [Longimicrobiales bacterium]